MLLHKTFAFPWGAETTVKFRHLSDVVKNSRDSTNRVNKNAKGHFF